MSASPRLLYFCMLSNVFLCFPFNYQVLEYQQRAFKYHVDNPSSLHEWRDQGPGRGSDLSQGHTLQCDGRFRAQTSSPSAELTHIISLHLHHLLKKVLISKVQPKCTFPSETLLNSHSQQWCTWCGLRAPATAHHSHFLGVYFPHYNVNFSRAGITSYLLSISQLA